MAKYNFKFKMKIVQKYIDGEGGYTYLGKKYGVRSTNQIKNWINAYKEFGAEGLFRVRQNKKYSVQFKINAIELYQKARVNRNT